MRGNRRDCGRGGSATSGEVALGSDSHGEVACLRSSKFSRMQYTAFPRKTFSSNI